MYPRYRCNRCEYEQWKIGRDSTGVLQPLADIQPDDIHHYGYCEQHHRSNQEKRRVLRKSDPARTSHIRSHRRAGQQQAWKIKNCIDPVRPTRDEAVKITERLL